MTASDALAFGLVTRLFPADTLHDEVLALADELAGRQGIDTFARGHDGTHTERSS